jgi:hypothetical protein
VEPSLQGVFPALSGGQPVLPSPSLAIECFGWTGRTIALLDACRACGASRDVLAQRATGRRAQREDGEKAIIQLSAFATVMFLCPKKRLGTAEVLDQASHPLSVFKNPFH